MVFIIVEYLPVAYLIFIHWILYFFIFFNIDNYNRYDGFKKKMKKKKKRFFDLAFFFKKNYVILKGQLEIGWCLSHSYRHVIRKEKKGKQISRNNFLEIGTNSSTSPTIYENEDERASEKKKGKINCESKKVNYNNNNGSTPTKSIVSKLD